MNAASLERWRERAIKILSQYTGTENAVMVLEDGKGFLTSNLPIKIIFYEDLNDIDAIE